MFLEIATTTGALLGAYLAVRVATSYIAILFGLMLLYSAFQSLSDVKRETSDSVIEDPLATKLKLNGSCPVRGSRIPYFVQNVPAGFSLMFGAGTLSGLLGIGSGAVKVIAMDRAMHIPFKVSTTTSNFMIGVTAAASAGVYLRRGYVDPGLAMPVMLGVLVGAFIGSKILTRASVPALRRIFAGVILLLGVEMIANGLRGRI